MELELELLTLLISSLLFCFLLQYFLALFRQRKLPPGPTGLPLIGNLFTIGSKPHESLTKLAKKHGPLMTIRLGAITCVVASSTDAAREILQKNDEACSGHVTPDIITALKDLHASVAWMPAIQPTWRIIRRALSTCLMHQHKLDSLRDLRYKVVEEMVDFVKQAGQREEPVDIGTLAFTTSLNKMSNTFISQNVADYKSKDVTGFKTAVKTIMQVSGTLNVADIFPWLKILDPQNLRSQAKVPYDWFDRVTKGFIDERLKHRQSGLPRYDDMLDSLLDFSQENESEFTIRHIRVLMEDLFIASTETTSTTTEWVMTELIRNPKVFAKVREEVSKSMGESGKIDEGKLIQLPYLHSVIKESMRIHSPSPFIVHKAETDVTLSGYFVPKNTQLLVNVWALSRDPEYWENPLEFIPERFLSSGKDYKGQHFEFLPFGSGRRMCPGIPLAHRVVSLIIAALVYHFDWKLPHSDEELDMSVTLGLSLMRVKPLLAIPVARQI